MLTDHARRSDPIQSDMTVKSLGKDTSLKSLIYNAVLYLQPPYATSCGVTDDEIWAHLEQTTGRRFQRNVLARTRGLMERDDLLIRVWDAILEDGSHRLAVRVPDLTPPTDTPTLF